MGKDFFDFAPSHTFLLLGNSQPKVETGGDSVWRRLRLIPFTHSVPESERIEDLQQRLVDEEGPGILAWIIRGAVGYAADGLDTPAEVLAATDAYRAEEDHLGRFIEDRCSAGGGEYARVEMAELRKAYDAWCKEQREDALTAQSFGRQLKQRFDVGTAKSNGRRFYTNVTLYAPETETESDDPRDIPGTNDDPQGPARRPLRPLLPPRARGPRRPPPRRSHRHAPPRPRRPHPRPGTRVRAHRHRLWQIQEHAGKTATSLRTRYWPTRPVDGHTAPEHTCTRTWDAPALDLAPTRSSTPTSPLSERTTP